MLFGDETRLGRPFAKDPAVVRFDGRYLLYYSIPGGNGHKGWGIGIAESKDLDNWRRISEILPVQDCEVNGFCAPGAHVISGRIHLFYQTYGNGVKDAICHAISDNGIDFVRNPTNPVFRPTGDWNCGRAIDADIIEHKGSLFMYWATRDPSFKTQMLGVSRAPIDSDFARRDWTQACDGPILKPELPWERDCIEAPAIFRHSGMLFMFYGGGYNNEPQQIGLAMSSDGISWRRFTETPFLPNGGHGDWNSSESGHPFAFTDDNGSLHLFYQGNDDNGYTWYIGRKTVKCVEHGIGFTLTDGKEGISE